MDRSNLVAIMSDIHEARTALMVGKGSDYAGENVLANFQRMTKMCVILDIDPRRSSTDCALFLALLKIDRWCNLRSKDSKPHNESIKDTIEDLHNYIDLAYACSKDTQ